MPDELVILALSAATVGLVHTLLGPDHYVPFVVLAHQRRWSSRRTMAVTALCGVGHVAGSVVLGALAITLGWAATSVAWFESARGELAGWLLLGFGVAYTAWGLRQALRARPHCHWHTHGDGTVHVHSHDHRGRHAHLHEAEAGARRSSTTWALFIIFVLGPCEPLVPLLMIPASRGNWWSLGVVTAVFGAVTVGTMMIVTHLGTAGLAVVRGARIDRYGHVLAGLALVACGLAIRFGL